MNWRPNGYKELRDEKINEVLERHGLPATGSFALAEAGSDAILEALKKSALYRNLIGMQTASDNAVICPQMPNERGWIIFIPDEN